MTKNDLKDFLDEKVVLYNNPKFLESDPLHIPHQFTTKEDVEIAGFLSATIAWGNRKSIITNANKMMHLLGNSPYDFVMSHQETDLEKFDGFVHRTFNAEDFKTFVICLKNIYKKHDGLENAFKKSITNDDLQKGISNFKKLFFETIPNSRTMKHVSDPNKISAAKRLNMFLRWMVRNDNAGVDLGIWKTIAPALLSCPLDVHSGNVARKLGLVTRRQNDGKALFELDCALRELDKNDPAKYDFALFGLGVFEGF